MQANGVAADGVAAVKKNAEDEHASKLHEHFASQQPERNRQSTDNVIQMTPTV